MCRSYIGKEKWVDAVVVQKLSPVTYEVGVSDGCCWKRHVNQIIDNNSTSVTGSSEMREIIEQVKEVGKENQGISGEYSDSENLTLVRVGKLKRLIKVPIKFNL